MNEYRTHYCNELRIADVGKEVRIAGWVQTIRDLGSVIFLDIRDHFGITQAVISDDERRGFCRCLCGRIFLHYDNDHFYE